MPRTKKQGRKRKKNQVHENITSNNEGTDPKQPKTHLDEPGELKSKELTEEDEKLRSLTKSSLVSNTKGFLIFFGFENETNYCEIIESALQLLNEYADTVYRTDKKSCYFEHKLSNTPPQSPIFIETDMDNPTKLIDAIFADLVAPGFNVEKVKGWSSVLPVIQTCDAQPDIVIQSVKAVLNPLFEEQENTKIPRINMNYQRFRVQDSDKREIVNEIKSYLASKRAEIKPTVEGSVESYLDVSIDLRAFRKVCCICYTDRTKSKRYSIVNTLNQRNKPAEETNGLHQGDN